MLAEIRPLMDTSVRHLRTADPKRDIFGQERPSEFFSTHQARVTYAAGIGSSGPNPTNRVEGKATIWLIDHPRPIVMSDQFELPDGKTYSVVGIELRTLPGGALHKVHVE